MPDSSVLPGDRLIALACADEHCQDYDHPRWVKAGLVSQWECPCCESPGRPKAVAPGGATPRTTFVIRRTVLPIDEEDPPLPESDDLDPRAASDERLRLFGEDPGN